MSKIIPEIIQESDIISKLKKARNEAYVQQEFISLFKDKLGLTLTLNERLIKGVPDSLFEDIILDYKFAKNFGETDEKNWISTKATQYMEEYEKLYGKKARLLIILSDKWIKYYDKDLIFIREAELTENTIKSLIFAIREYKTINSQLFSDLFGVYSPIFSEVIQYMKNYYNKHQDEIRILFEEWKSRFQIAYPLKEENIEIFFRHTYLSLLIKIILFITYLPNRIFSAQTFPELIQYFEKRNIAVFQYDFFYWILNISYITELLYNKLKPAQFEVEDIFKTIYQEFIKYDIRHEKGEYYTPNELAQLMLQDAYNFGEVVLDPACGSGTFLIECLKLIMENDNSKQDKIKACKNIYGFDLNPIAILTTKANLLLFYKFQDIKNFSLNVYLCNTLFPIIQQEQKSLDLGAYERYHLSAIDVYINISSLFFEKKEEFIKILKILDTSFSDTDDTEQLINIILNICKTNGLDAFLNQECAPGGMLLKDNLVSIIRQLHQFHLEQKDRIWLYLLYNYVGVKELYNYVDLIIGNPPWVVLRSITSKKYQEKIKRLAELLNIKPSAKQIPNLENATLFFYRCPKLYGKKNSTIFFVMTKEVIKGDHAQKFRYFSSFNNIKIWDFAKNTQETVFNVPHICIYAKFIKGTSRKFSKKIPIHLTIFNYNEEKEVYEIVNDNLLLEPYSYDDKKQIAKKFITLGEQEELIEIKTSCYKDLFHKGADLYPRSLIFLETEDIKHNLCLSSTDKRILSQAKDPWKKPMVKDEKINSEYLFTCILSKSLYPFAIKDYFTVFLPISKDLKYLKPKLLLPYAKMFYQRINAIYMQNKKGTTDVSSLYENLDHWGKLSNKMQLSEYKVVYNASGSRPESAVISNSEVLIDYTLIYYGTSNKEEAYFLCAILNSPFLAKNLSKIKSSRHIMKKLMEFPIPKYNPIDTKHKRLSELAQKCEQIVTDEHNKIIHKFSSSKIKKMIEKELSEIDSIVKLILK